MFETRTKEAGPQLTNQELNKPQSAGCSPADGQWRPANRGFDCQSPQERCWIKDVIREEQGENCWKGVRRVERYGSGGSEKGRGLCQRRLILMCVKVDGKKLM